LKHLRILISLLIVQALAATAVIAEERPMTPQDVAKLAQVVEVAISPDGKTIAYTRNEQRVPFQEEDGTAYRPLYLWTAETGETLFVGGELRVSRIGWTPDGKHVTFLAKREGDAAATLYGISVNGGEAKRLLSHSNGVSRYAFSPDGKQVLFITKEPKETDPNVAHGFTQVIYEEKLTNNWAYLANLEDADPGETAKHIPLAGSINGIAFSPDGKHVALAASKTSLVDHTIMYNRLHIVDLATHKVKHELNNPGKLGHFTFSPDGAYLAFISGATINDPSDGRLFVANMSNGKTEKYLMEAEGEVRRIAWHTERRLLFLWDVSVESSLQVLDAKTGKIEPVKEDFDFPPDRISVAGDHVAVVASTAKHPAELFHYNLKSGEVKRLTNSNPWLKDVAMGKQEVISSKARDGLRVDSLLIHPLNMEEGKRYPLIVVVHGGPEAHFRNEWITDYARLGQVASGRGFAVVYPNYRSSTGRGVAFSQMGFGRPAMEEFDDYVDVVKDLINRGIVDKDKVGITGGSYGGYATAWGATKQTEHFAAGVMFVGISNKVSKWGTSDIPDETYLVHDKVRVWENFEKYEKASPIYYAEQSKTPLLILHGQKDPRVPYSQSVELFRFLKTQGKVPVRLVLYPEEQHGNRAAASRYDYNLRALRWFEHYLKGPGGDKPGPDVDYTPGAFKH
jgi:dipeptidyl aminopeptidase/acylaminoacyl peptidase